MKLLRASELAEQIGASERQVYRMLERKTIPAAIHEPGIIRFDPAEVRTALAKRAVKRAKVPTY